MTRKKTGGGCGAFVLILIVLGLVMQIGPGVWAWVLGAVVVLAVGLYAVMVVAEASRRSELRRKYGDGQIVSRILKREFWVGQSDEALRDSLGEPHDRKIKETGEMREETWYYSRADNLRVFLKDGTVTGWERREHQRR